MPLIRLSPEQYEVLLRRILPEAQLRLAEVDFFVALYNAVANPLPEEEEAQEPDVQQPHV